MQVLVYYRELLVKVHTQFTLEFCHIASLPSMSSLVVVSDQRSVIIDGIALTADVVSLLVSMARCSLATLASVRVESPDAMSAAASLPLMPGTDGTVSITNDTEADLSTDAAPEEGAAV